jgi:hypothetical protein
MSLGMASILIRNNRYRQAIAAAIFFTVIILVHRGSLSRQHKGHYLGNHAGQDDVLCSNFSGGENIVITVKTGATEASLKLPPLMQTSLKCAPNVIIFSDLEQDVAGYHAIDVLADVADEVKTGNDDFNIYREQQRLGNPDKIIEQLRNKKHPKQEGEYAAWTMDKYKVLHLIERSWEMMPERDWYFHMEADTYLAYSTLIEWVKRLDPSKEMFIGSIAVIGDTSFPHGGSGVLVSREGMRNLVVRHNGTAAAWDPNMHKHCCGDLVIGKVIKNIGLDISNGWPTINGESTTTIPFNRDHWCQPVATMHHVTAEEIGLLVKLEHDRPNKTVSPIF